MCAGDVRQVRLVTEEKCYIGRCVVRGKRGIRRPLCTCETLCERPRGVSFIWMAMSFCRSHRCEGFHFAVHKEARVRLATQPGAGSEGWLADKVCGLRAAQRRRDGTWTANETDAILMRY